MPIGPKSRTDGVSQGQMVFSVRWQCYLLIYKVNLGLFNLIHPQCNVTEMELGYKPIVSKLLPQ